MSEQTREHGETGGRRAPPPEVIPTRRLVLRPPETADAGDLARLANDREVALQTRRMPHPYSLKDAEEWIATVTGSANEAETAFILVRRSDAALLGAAGFAVTEEEDFEIGYWLGKPYWGQGFATEALQAVIDHAFIRSGIERLIGRCRVANTPSRRVLEKCGFQYTGSGMCSCSVLNSAVPSDDFVLERSVWLSLKRWGAA